jgi:PAS domain S-box-containing protein
MKTFNIEDTLFQRLQQYADDTGHTVESLLDQWLSQPYDAEQHAQNHFQHLAENARDIIYRIDLVPDMHFAYVSPSVTEITGYTPEDHYRDPELGHKLVHPDDNHKLQMAIMQKQDGLVVLRWICKDGTIIWTEQHNTLIYDQDGELVAIEGIARDITRRKQTEADAFRTRDILQRIFDNSHFLMAYMDADFNFIQVNERYAQADNKSPADFLNQNHFDLYPHAENEAIFRRVVRTGQPVKLSAKPFTYPGQPERGTTYWDWSLQPTIDEHGTVEGLLLILIDVTSRVEARNQLRESEFRYRTVADFSTDWTYWQKADGNLQYVSPACEKITGYTNENFMTQPDLIEHIIYQDDRDIWHTHRRRRDIKNHSQMIQFRIQHRDESIRWIEHICRPVYTEANGFDGYRVSNTDITDRKRAEQALRESENRLRMTVEGVQAGTWEWNIQTGETVFNERWAEIIGYRLEELQPTDIETWMKYSHPDDLEESNRRLQEHFDGVTDHYDCEVRMKHRAGHWVWIWDRGMVMEWTPDGKPLRMFGTHVDVTDRKEAETQRLDVEQRYRLLTNLTFEGIVLHMGGIISDANPAMVRIFGYTLEELIGQQAIDLLFTPESAQIVHEKVQQQHAEPYEVVGVHKDGHHIPIEIEARQINATLRVASVRDITYRKQVQSFAVENAGLRASFKKEQKQNALIQRIISALSHDLRTPLSVIATSRDLLSNYYDRMTPEKRQEKLDTIRRQIQFALELLEDTVEMARGNRDAHELQPAPVNLAALCQVSVDEMSDALDGQHQLHFVNVGQVETITVDEVLVSRVLLNLLSNAIKYSPDDSNIWLELDQHPGWVVLRVIDEGVGISQEDLPHIFDPFYRVDEVKHINGTGLGLSIVQDCVNRHQGQIAVKSVVGQGTTFTVELPV